MSMYNCSGYYEDLIIPQNQNSFGCGCGYSGNNSCCNYANSQNTTPCCCGGNMMCGQTSPQCCGIVPCQPSNVQAFAYMYNNSAQTVAVESDVSFNIGGINCGGISHINGSSQISINNAGIYLIWFYVLGTSENQFSLFVNGTSVPGSIYASPTASTATIGFATVQLRCGDVLSLRNHSSAEPVVLADTAGGTQPNVNASIALYKLC